MNQTIRSQNILAFFVQKKNHGQFSLSKQKKIFKEMMNLNLKKNLFCPFFPQKKGGETEN